MEVLGIGQAKSAHTKRMSRLLEVALKVFPVTISCQSSDHTYIA